MEFISEELSFLEASNSYNYEHICPISTFLNNPWNFRWLKGNEYASILLNYEFMEANYRIPICYENPQELYENPLCNLKSSDLSFSKQKYNFIWIP